MSMEKRLLLACAISAVIFIVWMQVFPPPKPAPVEEAVRGGEAGPGGEAGLGKGQVLPESDGASEVVGLAEGSHDEQGEVREDLLEVREGVAEETVRLGNDVVSVEVTNRGAAISSLKLLQFESDDYDGEPLELVQAVEDEQRTLPLQLRVGEAPDQRLYEVEPIDDGFLFVWADGKGSRVEKSVRLVGDGYGLKVSIERLGGMGESLVSVGTGMRNTGPAERGSRLSQWGDAAVLMDGELERYRRKKVDEPRRLVPQTLGFAGFEDTYFLSALRPSTRVDEVVLRPIEHVVRVEEGEEAELERALEVLLRPVGSLLEGELLSIPKEYDLVQSIGGGVQETLDFGIFNWFSVLFLKALRWIHGLVNNWGVAIVLLTLGIRIFLFPLMHKSTVSMRRMAKLQPKVKAIQAKYKKGVKSDPQARAKMSQETMELYREEGVNPMGGCLPLLVQLPILWALYQLFLRAIELRHAPFFLWITDLSAKDPYLVTPILMTATMWLQQKLAPQAGDPQQQRMLKWLPLVFGVMFLQFPSGLVLYWLANNVVTIIQQEITLRLIGEKGGARTGGGRGKGKGK